MNAQEFFSQHISDKEGCNYTITVCGKEFKVQSGDDYLRIFTKGGEYISYTYDETLAMWEGFDIVVKEDVWMSAQTAWNSIHHEEYRRYDVRWQRNGLSATRVLSLRRGEGSGPLFVKDSDGEYFGAISSRYGFAQFFFSGYEFKEVSGNV
jgi:hypothetical protein